MIDGADETNAATARVRRSDANMFFFNGQRETTGYFRVDGLSANLGLPADASNVPLSAGATPARTANGAANAVISALSVNEAQFLAWQYGQNEPRTPGRQVSLATQQGTQDWHGAAFAMFDGAALRANDWFANSRGLARPATNLTNFGGRLEHQVFTSETYFLATYEGLRGDNAGFVLTDVPALATRSQAIPALRPLLNAFPLPNGTARNDGLGEFAATFANPVKHDFLDIKLNHRFSGRYIWGRYSYSGSHRETLGVPGFAPNVRQLAENRTQTLNGGFSQNGSYTTLDLRANYSRVRLTQAFALEDLGGAQPATLTNNAPRNNFSRYEFLGRDATLAFGPARANRLEQINLTGNASRLLGNHLWQWGADYRRLQLNLQPQATETALLLTNFQPTTATVARAQALMRPESLAPCLDNLNLHTSYGWRSNQVTNFTAGLSWELGPPPKVAGQTAPLWRTDYRNFAPRLGFAWSFPRYNYRTTLRAGLGWFYELSNTGAIQVFGQSAPYLTSRAALGVPFVSLTPNLSNAPRQPILLTFAPQLRTPYSRQFSLSVRHNLSNNIELTATYQEAQGRRLWLTRTTSDATTAPLALTRSTDNGGFSSFRALNVRFQIARRNGFETLINYAWAQARDNYTPDTLAQSWAVSADARQDYGASDFDARHTLKGFLAYTLPQASARAWLSQLTKNWRIGSLFAWHTATPVNVFYGRLNSFGITYLRPNVQRGAAFYLANEGRLRQLNAAAFALPVGASANSTNGTLARNALRGYGFAQVDVTLSRQFRLRQDSSLTFRAEVSNLLNRANFVAPQGFDASIGTVLADGSFIPNTAFGQTRHTAGRDTSAGANFLTPYQNGGARAVQLSLALRF